jgi:hypothetical protein
MMPHLVGLLVFACLFGAALLGMRLRAWLPEHHISPEAKDSVRVAMATVLFLSFGLFAPFNGTVIGGLMLSALSVSGAIFLVLELALPFGGLISISSGPLRVALTQLGH